MLETQIFDDGSTLSYDNSTNYVSSTPATDFGTGPTFPGAQTIGNALAYGFGRWVDYKTRPSPPSNNIPTLVKPSEQAAMQTGGFPINSKLVIFGLIGLGVFAALNSGKA